MLTITEKLKIMMVPVMLLFISFWAMTRIEEARNAKISLLGGDRDRIFLADDVYARPPSDYVQLKDVRRYVFLGSTISYDISNDEAIPFDVTFSSEAPTVGHDWYENVKQLVFSGGNSSLMCNYHPIGIGSVSRVASCPNTNPSSRLEFSVSRDPMMIGKMASFSVKYMADDHVINQGQSFRISSPEDFIHHMTVMDEVDSGLTKVLGVVIFLIMWFLGFVIVVLVLLLFLVANIGEPVR
ncbi:MAG: hypothetical protein ABR929_13825 [Roseiarcus sp.]|jgi:hypothetical protein